MKELLTRYMAGTYQDRTLTATVGSFAINALIGTGKLVLGIYLLSPWFIANAIYYLLLCFARGRALRKYKAIAQIADERERYDREFTVYRHSGIFICLLGLSYLLVCLRMYFAGDATVYNGLPVILGVATVSFTKMGLAIYGTVTTRHMRSPIVSAIKAFSFTDAFVSIVVTQCALLVMEQVENAVIYSAITGMVISAIFIFEGLFMLFKKKKHPVEEPLPTMEPKHRTRKKLFKLLKLGQ